MALLNGRPPSAASGSEDESLDPADSGHQLKRLQRTVNDVSSVMQNNIINLLDRGENLDDLMERSEALSQASVAFLQTCRLVQVVEQPDPPPPPPQQKQPAERVAIPQRGGKRHNPRVRFIFFFVALAIFLIILLIVILACLAGVGMLNNQTMPVNVTTPTFSATLRPLK